jgi:hypothetical protein
MFNRSDCHSGGTARRLTLRAVSLATHARAETPVESQAIRVRLAMRAGGENHAECSRDHGIRGGERGKNTTVTSFSSPPVALGGFLAWLRLFQIAVYAWHRQRSPVRLGQPFQASSLRLLPPLLVSLLAHLLRRYALPESVRRRREPSFRRPRRDRQSNARLSRCFQPLCVIERLVFGVTEPGG